MTEDSFYELPVHDDDAADCDTLSDCPCSNYEIYIQDDNGVFEVVKNVLRVKDRRVFIEKSGFHLLIGVKKLDAEPSTSDDVLKLEVLRQTSSSSRKPTINRVKRETLSSTMPTSLFNISSSNPTRNENDSVPLGNSITYSLSMKLGTTGADYTNALVEISTNLDSEVGACAGICNVVIDPVPAGVSASSPNINQYVDEISPHVYSTVIIDYGYMSISSVEVEFIITYDVITVKCAQSPGTQIYPSIGVDLHDSEVIWVASDLYITSDPATQVYELTCNLTNPTTMAAETCEIVSLDCYVGHQSDLVTMDLLAKPDALTGLFTGVNLYPPKIGEFGNNFCDHPFEPLSKRFKQSLTEDYVRSITNFGIITNRGVDKIANIADNMMKFAFVICAKDEGVDVSLAVGLSIGTTKLFVGQFSLTVSGTGSSTLPSSTPDVREVSLSSNEIEINGTINYMLKYRFASGGSSYPVKIELDDLGGRLSVCSVVLQSAGANIFTPPDFTNCVIYDGVNYICDVGDVQAYNYCTKPECNELIINVGISIVEHASNTDGATITPPLKVSGQLLVMESITLKTAAFSVLPTATVENKVEWDNWMLDGVMAGSVTMTFESLQTVGYSTFEAIAQCDDASIKLKMCLLEITAAGNNLPCVKGNIEGKQTPTSYSITDSAKNSDPDVAQIELSNVCASKFAGSNVDNQMSFRYAVKSVAGSAINAKCSIGLGLKMNTNFLWIGIDSRDTSAYAPTSTTPVFQTEVLNVGKTAAAGEVLYLATRLKLEKQTVGKYSVTLDVSGSASVFGICGVQIYHVGKNIPCLDVDNDVANTSTPDADGLSPTYKIDFPVLVNIGQESWFLENYDTDDSIGILYSIQVISGSGPQGIQYTVDQDGSEVVSGTVNVELNTTAAPVPSDYVLPVNELHLSVNKTAYENFPTEVTIKLGADKFENIPVNVIISVAGPSQVCSLLLTYNGDNCPCSGSDPIIGEAIDAHSMNISFVLHNMVVSSAVNSSIIGLTAIVKPDASVTGTLTVTSTVTTGSVVQPANTTDLILQTGAPAGDPMVSITPFTANTTAVVTKIRESVKLVMGLRLSQGLSGVKANFTCPISDDMSACIFKDCRIVSAGKNLLCFNVTLMNEASPASFTSLSGNSQLSSCQIDFGGLYVGLLVNDTAEDEILMEVEIQPTDHPLNVEAATSFVKLDVVADNVDSTITAAQTELTIDRSDADVATQAHDLVVSVTKSSVATLQDGDTITVTAQIKHMNESRWEQAKAAFCTFFPPYFTVDTHSSSVTSTTLHNLCVKRENFLFDDETWNVTMTAKLVKANMMKVGEGQDTFSMTIPYRMYCTSFHQGDTNLKSCGPISHENIVVSGNSIPCSSPLLDTVEDCQFFAPTSRDDSSYPQFSRLSDTTNSYVPLPGPGEYQPYVQVDFGNATKIMRLLIRKVAGLAYVTKYKPQYSNDGHIWFGNDEKSIDSMYVDTDYNDTVLPMSDEAVRFFRLLITETSSLSSYLGIKFEVFGCKTDQSSDAGVCIDTKTILTKDSTPGRHFVVDPNFSSIVLCDYSHYSSYQNAWKTSCYYSKSGSTWEELVIVEVFGISSNGHMYGRSSNDAYLYSENGGSSWILTTQTDKESQTFSDLKQIIISDKDNWSTDNTDVTAGSWTASYDGLMLSSNLVLRWGAA